MPKLEHQTQLTLFMNPAMGGNPPLFQLFDDSGEITRWECPEEELNVYLARLSLRQIPPWRDNPNLGCMLCLIKHAPNPGKEM